MVAKCLYTYLFRIHHSVLAYHNSPFFMSSRHIIDAIQHISGVKHADAVSYLPCTVKSVNEAARTCVCLPQGGYMQAPISDALLMASVDDGIFYIPSLDSTVLVLLSKFAQPCVVMFSCLTKILYTVGGSQLKVIDGTIQLNDGSLGGLAKIAALTQKLNNLENLLNGLIAKYNAHTHILALTTGTGTAAPTITNETNTILPTQQSEIENTTVTHGV